VLTIVLLSGCTDTEVAQWVWAMHGADGHTLEVEACVIAHESGGNTDALNARSGAYGLFQFLPSLYYRIDAAGYVRSDPVTQAEAGWELFSERGWSPWVTAPACGA
jgi:hypothetical protein